MATMRTAWALSLRRQGASLLAVILSAVLALPAQALTSNTRVASSVRVAGETVCTGVFEAGAQPCTGLFAGDNPVNNIDPSGHEFNLVSLQTSIATGLRITAQVGVRTGRVLTRARQFFWNNQRFQAVSRAYWRLNGPANGRSLHHWLIPQRWNFVPQGLRNAGFNLLEMPRLLPGNLGLNQWMGFAVRWGGYRAIFAYTIENGIKILIPLSIYQAATIGNHNDNGEPEEITLTPAHWEDDTGFEQLRTITDEMAEDLMDEPYPTNQPPP